MKLNPTRLLAYGFAEQQGEYHYQTDLLNGQFTLSVWINLRGEMRDQLIDNHAQTDYILHKTPQAVGTFVGAIRHEYQAILQDIADNCFGCAVYQTPLAQWLITHCEAVYQATPEFLWPTSKTSSVLRRQDSQKWFAVLMTLPAAKLGLAEDKRLEVLNLHLPADEIVSLLDHHIFFPAYHMNKKSWISVNLTADLAQDTLLLLLEKSYQLAKKSR